MPANRVTGGVADWKGQQENTDEHRKGGTGWKSKMEEIIKRMEENTIGKKKCNPS